MARLFDRVKMTVSGTPGTGTITLGSAVSGFQTFDDSGVPDGVTISYAIEDGSGWEVGRGVYTVSGTTLTRGPLFSSNSNAAVSLTSAAIVRISILSEDLIQTITLTGNTAGSATPLISPDLEFAGGLNITLSGTSNTISIVGAATVAQTVQTLGLFAVGNTTGTTSSQTRDARTISFDGAGIASVGFSAGSIIISASTAATNPLLSIYAVGNTTSDASSGLNQAGSLSFDGAGIVSVGVAGSSVVISAPSPAASGTIQNRFAGGNSFGQSSSAVGTLSSLNVSATGGISAGFSTDASSGVLMLSVAPPVASGAVGNYFASGNTTAISSSSTHTLSNISISGAGIVSVGVSTTGAGAGILVVSAPSPAASQGSLSLYAVGNTTISSSTSSALPEALSLSGAGIVTVGYSSNTVLISATTVASGAVQNQYAIGNTTAATSSTTQTLSSVSLSGAGIVSVGYSTTAAGAGAIVISASTAATNPLLSIYAVGNTTTSVSSGLNEAGSLSFDGAGIVSVGISGSSVVISAPTPAASGAVQNQYAIGNTTAATSSTTQTLSSVSLSGAGIVSVGYSTTAAGAGAIVISASTAATNPLLSLYAVGNTTTSVSSGLNQAGSISFDGAGIVSVGISGSSVVISAPSPTASGTVGNYFASGNTTAISSSSTHTLSNISVSGAGIVSVGVSTTGAAAGILLISASTAATNPLLSIFAVGNTTSSVSSGVIAAGSVSFDGAGVVSVGVSNSSVVISAPASATAGNFYAIGNTTGLSSSSTMTLSSASLSGAGGVSVGFSTTAAGAGAYQISSPLGNLSLFAVGNTTGASSSTSSVLPEALSFSGSGAISVGFSSNTIIISGATVAAGAQSLFAVGNTTSSVSSGVAGAGSLSFDAVGALSVGVSNSSIVLSTPNVSTLTGVSGLTVSTAGNTISIGEQVVSYLEPRPWQGTTTSTWALGTMAVEPLLIQRALSVNQANFLSSRAVVAPAMTLSSSTASRTVTASATWGSTASLVFYSQQDATSFSTFSSTTASFGMSAVLSASFSSSSKTGSQTVTFGWPQGTSAAVTSSMSTTFSTVSASIASQVMHTSSSLFANWLRNDYPFAASFPPGEYIVGIMWSSASGSSTLSTGLVTIAAPTWLATNGVLTEGPGTSVIAVPGAAISNPFPGVGSTSSAGSAVPATIAWNSISSGASHPINYFYMFQA